MKRTSPYPSSSLIPGVTNDQSNFIPGANTLRKRFLKSQTKATIHHTATLCQNRGTSRESTWRLSHVTILLSVSSTWRTLRSSFNEFTASRLDLTFSLRTFTEKKIHMLSIENTLQIKVGWRCTSPSTHFSLQTGKTHVMFHSPLQPCSRGDPTPLSSRKSTSFRLIS